MADEVLNWVSMGSWEEAVVGCFDDGDGVRFTLVPQPTCYRRGPWKLLVEVAFGPKHHLWGCFDDADQPLRYYHAKSHALAEAELIAKVLLEDRMRHNRKGEELGREKEGNPEAGLGWDREQARPV